MRKSPLGNTELLVSEIALGGGVTGGILIQGSESRRIGALQRAIAAGINWIDTAPAYGDGVSEETIGRYLSSLDPRPYVSTKVRLEAGDLQDIAGAIERSVERSLKRLRVSKIDLLQLHNQIGTAVGGRLALTPEQVLDHSGVADTFDRFKEQGLIHAGGITAAGDTDACLEVIESTRFDTAQVYYNVINPSAAWSRASVEWRMQDFSGIIPTCWRLNMGMLNIRVWAGGPLANSRRPDHLTVFASGTDIDNEMRCAARVRAVLGDAYGTPAQVALRFALGNRDIATRIIGIAELRYLDEAIEAVKQGPLPGAAIDKLEELWATGFK